MAEDECFKKGFKGEQGKPLLDKKKFQVYKQLWKGRRLMGMGGKKGSSRVKGLRIAWGTGGEGGRRNENRKAGEGK